MIKLADNIQPEFQNPQNFNAYGFGKFSSEVDTGVSEFS